MTGRIAIMRYMQAEILDHVDPRTGEVNDTGLAEDAADHFGDEVDDRYFSFAFIVAERYEIKSGIKAGSLANLSGFINSLPSDWL